MSNITFVTGLFKIYDDTNTCVKSIEERISLFKEMATTGINICIFVSPEYKDIINELPDNVKLIDMLTLKDTYIGKIMYQRDDITLPDNRSIEKDTIDYIVLMNVKVELVKKITDINPWNTDHFCWIDFNLPHVFKDKVSTYAYLSQLKNCQVQTDNIVIPGCWSEKFNNIDYLKNNITWRFCGGVFLGNKKTINHFYYLYLKYLDVFLNITKKIVWEVNFWTWLETTNEFSPVWFKADHNDSIILFPKELFFNKEKEEL